MRLYLCFIILCIATTHCSIYSTLRENVLSFLQKSIDKYDTTKIPHHQKERVYSRTAFLPRQREADTRAARTKAKVISKVRKNEKTLNDGRSMAVNVKDIGGMLGKERYHMDPVLNFLKRRSGLVPNFRRQRGKKRKYSSSLPSTSSSIEMADWKEEWDEHWIKKKFEAINSTANRGDVVNMVAARPWGTPCGDPNQHDMPWGTCMLPMECDAEYRIYRGDYFCGRTSFVCCALMYTNYDLYQGFDVSFDDTSFSTDTNERHAHESKDIENTKRKSARKKRKRDRIKRKRIIKRTIRRITRELEKILSRVYRNGTTARKKKTKQLKKYVKDLKKKYRKERKVVKEIHELEMIKVDAALQRRLDQIRELNQNFIKNATFRDIVVNGTMNKQSARMLIQAYPELSSYMDPGLKLRRSGGDDVETPKDYLEYDIEYGLLYS